MHVVQMFQVILVALLLKISSIHGFVLQQLLMIMGSFFSPLEDLDDQLTQIT